MLLIRTRALERWSCVISASRSLLVAASNAKSLGLFPAGPWMGTFGFVSLAYPAKGIGIALKAMLWRS